MASFFLYLFMYLAVSSAGEAATYEVDYGPFKAHPELSKRYEELQATFSERALTAEEHVERMDAIRKVLALEPKWWDGYWLLATDSFLAGSAYHSPKQHALARKIYQQGVDAAEKCLAQDPNHMICKFFQASLLAKIASIDGIFASLKYGRIVLEGWLHVTESHVDLAFRPNVSLIGSSYYGLGLFYRLVPDSIILRWLWGIRGSIDQSIYYHRKALERDSGNPCAQMMLAVSLLCKVRGDTTTPAYQEAMGLLDKAAALPATDLAQGVCIHDVPAIRSQPRKTCGYTQAKYQDAVSADELRKSKS